MFSARPVQGARTRSVIALCAALLLTGCKVDLYTKLSEREANEMVSVLLQNDLKASRIASKDGSNTVQVEEAQLGESIELLRKAGYPRQTFATMGEIFKGGGLVATPTEERARFIYALSEELSKTVSSIDGVLSARIHVVLPKNDPLRQDYMPSSASVFIRHDALVNVRSLLASIKMLVSNSIEGLSYDKVSVVLVPVDRASEMPMSHPSGVAKGSGGSYGPVAGVLGAGLVAVLAGLVAWVVVRRRTAGPAASLERPLVFKFPPRQPA